MTGTASAPHGHALSADQVIDWLRHHPDFLTQHPEACALLTPPASNEEGVIDFQRYMVKRLRADREQALHSTRQLVDMARANSSNLDRMHRAALNVLEAHSFADFIERITCDLPTLLGVDIIALVIESDSTHIPNIALSNIRIVPEGTLYHWLQDKPVLLQSNIGGIEAIYGAGAGLVSSQALVRIDVSRGDSPPALLAFGSRDPILFSPDQATDLVLFLAQVIERLLRLWLVRAAG